MPKPIALSDIGIPSSSAEDAPRRSRAETALPESRTATDRSLAIIDVVLSSDSPLNAKTIGAALDLPKATVHRLLGALEDKGLLAKDPVSGGYVSGPGLCDMAFKILRKSAASADRRAVLTGLAAQMGETCNLGILDGSEARYVDRVEASQSPLKLDFRPGSRVPLHASAMGKLFLASMPDGALLRYLMAIRRTAFTPMTLVDEGMLRQALAAVREAGYAADDEEYVLGVNCLAVPVPVSRARHLVALAVQAPKSRRHLGELKGFLPLLQDAARRLADIFDAETQGRA
jgi:IclR family transcriptional regulator, acetate operon repressor